MSERQFNEVTCDICHRKQVCEIGKCPADMCGNVTINRNVFYENRETEYKNVCVECLNKISYFIETIEGGKDADRDKV